MNKINNFLVQKPTINPQASDNTRTNTKVNSGVNFQSILDQHINQSTELKISKHAEMRMTTRKIKLTDEQMSRVNTAVEKANEKGVKESLVVVDDIALVVSVKNKTIITAVDSKELKDNVFTNIDGAVII